MWDDPEVQYCIDNPQQSERLLARLPDYLPFPAFVRPSLAQTIREKLPNFDASRQYRVLDVKYLGDPGGIMCQLEIPELGNGVFVVSITHLAVGPRMPLAREIAAYQKHRTKRIRRNDRLNAQQMLEKLL